MRFVSNKVGETLTANAAAGRATMALLALFIALAAGARADTLDGPGAQADEVRLAPVDRSLLLGFLADPTTATVVDARSAEEYAAQHVTGALNIPHDELANHAHLLPVDPGQPVVVYCRTGKRASALADAIRDLGFDNVSVLPPAQLFWSSALVVFNCAVDASEPDEPIAARVRR
jgi:phage shock protein E